jgi:hypothetical protein
LEELAPPVRCERLSGTAARSAAATAGDVSHGPRWSIAALAALAAASIAGCAADPYDREKVTSRDCFLCHAEDYESATDPVHVGVNPTTCWECHETTGWRPAEQGTHPDDDFRISTGQHSDILCADCHDAGRGLRANGANTDCIGCHLGSHEVEVMNAMHADRGVASYPTDRSQPNFCLACHIDGNAPGTPHPEGDFPIREGNHAGIECLSCHDTARGSSADGANTGCTLCHLGAHPRSETDVIHAGVSGYPAGDAPPNFCLGCHPHGNAESRGHPESVFPITHGPHSRWACRDCHDEAVSSVNSRENTDCVGCHTGQHANEGSNGEHREGGTGTRFRQLQATGSPHFCLECHPHGWAGDD